MSHTVIEEMLAESGLGSEDSLLADALTGLDDLADQAPAPSAELAALFDGRPAAQSASPVTAGPRKRAVAGVVVLALSGVGATGLSAAANTLPAPIQHHVSQFSRHYLPFDLPEPSSRHEVVPKSSGDLADLDREGAVTEQASRAASDRSTPTGPGGRGHDATPPGPGRPLPGPSAPTAGPGSQPSSQSWSQPSGPQPKNRDASDDDSADQAGDPGEGDGSTTTKDRAATKTKGGNQEQGESADEDAAPADDQGGGDQGGGDQGGGDQDGGKTVHAPEPSPALPLPQPVAPPAPDATQQSAD